MSPKNKDMHAEMAGRYASCVYQSDQPQETFEAMLPAERDTALRALEDRRRAHRFTAFGYTFAAFCWIFLATSQSEVIPLPIWLASFLVLGALFLFQAVKWHRHARLMRTLDNGRFWKETG